MVSYRKALRSNREEFWTYPIAKRFVGKGSDRFVRLIKTIHRRMPNGHMALNYSEVGRSDSHSQQKERHDERRVVDVQEPVRVSR